jgi:hypothetical protein
MCIHNPPRNHCGGLAGRYGTKPSIGIICTGGQEAIGQTNPANLPLTSGIADRRQLFFSPPTDVGIVSISPFPFK